MHTPRRALLFATACALAACGENKLESAVSANLGPQVVQNARYAVDDLSKALRASPDCTTFAAEAQRLREMSDAQAILKGLRDLRQRAIQANCLR